jgi:hypothetical protein
MKYKIIKKFGPGDEQWDKYAQWAGLHACKEYYSIDSINRESLFTPDSEEDWENCINENFMLNIITNLNYDLKIAHKFPSGEIIGVIENPKHSNEEIPINHILMGYDIIDEYTSISLVTNWGGKEEGIKILKLNTSALIDNLNYAYELKGILHRDFKDDDHAKRCEVWSVYKLKV